MMSSTKVRYISAVLILATLQLISCGKEDPGTGNNNNNPDCTSLNITATATPAANCANGEITVAASGASGLTYKLGASGTYQSSPTFTNVASGSHVVFAKSSNGCEKSTTVTVTSSDTRGAQFAAVRNLVTAKCTSCHNGTAKEGGQDFTVDCNVVSAKARIKVRAVDEGTMPPTGPLSAAEKAIIVNWINGGGTLTN